MTRDEARSLLHEVIDAERSVIRAYRNAELQSEPSRSRSVAEVFRDQAASMLLHAAKVCAEHEEGPRRYDAQPAGEENPI